MGGLPPGDIDWGGLVPLVGSAHATLALMTARFRDSQRKCADHPTCLAGGCALLHNLMHGGDHARGSGDRGCGKRRSRPGRIHRI